MNKVVLIGNLTRDCELRTTTSGKTVCGFGLAVNRRRKVEGQPEADFFNINAWGKMGETCAQYLSKGRKVCVTGQVSVRTYEAQDGSTRATMEVFAEDVEFLSSKSDAASVPDSVAGNGGGGFVPVDDPDSDPF